MANYQSPDQMQKSPKKSAVYGYVQEQTPLVLNIEKYLKESRTSKGRKKQ